MKKFPIYQIDAFTSEVFKGNPAAVVILDQWLPDETLLNIAAENNLAETAFIIKNDPVNRLRWFTPTCEIPLCGHGTLATAYVLFNELNYEGEKITFTSLSGSLSVSKQDEMFILDFPKRDYEPTTVPKAIIDTIGFTPQQVISDHREYVLIYDDETIIERIDPDFSILKHHDAVVVTAASKQYDFISRNFHPSAGIDEDPVTGSSHCLLANYWSKQLGKTKLHAYQASERGGEMTCEIVGDRVKLIGNAVKFLEGFCWLE